MNAKLSVFAIGVEAIIYLLLYNLHDCTFKLATFRRRAKEGSKEAGREGPTVLHIRFRSLSNV